jgi:hypothetical protein
VGRHYKKRNPKAVEPAKKGGKWKCENCGEFGHGAKTCKNGQSLPTPGKSELPDDEIEKNRAGGT